MFLSRVLGIRVLFLFGTSKSVKTRSIEIDKTLRQEYATYFSVYDKIGRDLKLPVQGLDMFLYREGIQNSLKPHIFKSNNYGDFNDFNNFANDQLNLCSKI